MVSAQNEVIKTFMASLDKTTLKGTAALDEAIKACSNFNGIQDAIDHMISDCKTALNTDSTGEYFLRKYCGIDCWNDDTGAITGSDAGGSVVKNAEDIVPESGEAVYPPSNTFTIRGLTVVVPDKSTLTKEEQSIVKGLYSWWIDGALKLIEESYGYSFTDSDKSNNTLYVRFCYNWNRYSWLANVQGNTLNINMEYYNDILDGDVNGGYKKHSGLHYLALNSHESKYLDTEYAPTYYLDRIIAHELTHYIMEVGVTSFYELPQFIKEGMAELTRGADPDRGFRNLSSNSDNLLNALNINNLGTGDDECYAAGYMFLRYLARQAAGVDEDIDVNLIEFGDKDNSYGDYKFSTEDVTTVVGNGGNDIFYTHYGRKILFEYANGDGNDTIVYPDDNNTIKITSGTIDEIEYLDDNVILKIGNGSIYLKGAYNGVAFDSSGNRELQYPHIINSDGEIIDIFHSINEEVSDTLISGTKFSDEIYFKGKNITINGGAGNDTIRNNNSIYDDYDNNGVTINGGAGNDLIYGGFHNDLVVTYAEGDGDDTIGLPFPYDSFFQKIKLTKGSIDSWSTNYNDVVFKIGSGSITVEDARGKEITIEDATGNVSTKIYGESPIVNNRQYELIKGTSADDEIYCRNWDVTVDAGAGDDLIYSKGNENSINGGSGNDEIIIADSTTINAGTGNDTIEIRSKYQTRSLIEYAVGDGDDVIIGFGDSDKLKLINASVSGSIINGDDLILQVNDNFITFKDRTEYISVIDASGALQKYDGTFTNTVPGAVINIGDKGCNKIKNEESATGVTINGSAGDDYIYNNASCVTINTSAGNDTISNGRNEIVINSGEGNDLIYSSLKNTTINAGSGDDSISAGYDNIIEYNVGDGNDIIYGYSGILKVNGGQVESFEVDDYDVLVKIGDNTIRYVNLIGRPLFVMDSDGKIVAHYVGDWKNYSEPDEPKYVKVGTLLNNVDNIIYTKNAAIDIRTSDTTVHILNEGNRIYNHAAKNTVYGSEGNDTIYNEGYVEVGTGWWAGQTAYFNPKQSVIISGSGDDYIYNKEKFLTIEAGLGNDTIECNENSGSVMYKYSKGDGNDIIYGYNSTDTLNITGGDYTSLTNEQDVILHVVDGSITLVGAANTTLNIEGKYAESTNSTQDTVAPATIPAEDTTSADTTSSGQDTIAPVTIPAEDTTPVDTLPIDNTILMLGDTDKSPVTIDPAIKTVDASTRSKSAKITGNSLANTIQGGKGKDIIYGRTGNDEIFGNADNDKLFGEEGADTLYGGRGKNTLTGGKGRDVFVFSNRYAKDIITDYTSGEDKINISIGTIKKVSLSRSDVVLKVGSGQIKVKKAKDKALTIVNANGVSSVATFTDTLKLTNSSAASIKVTDSLIKTIDASSRTKAINITGNSNANTITGGKGSDTLTGGSGKDTFIYTGGNDVITDYAVNQDKIKISTGTLKSANISGNDVVLKVNSNSIKVKSAKNKAISITDSKNNNFALLVGSTAADKMNGTSSADSILGGAGNDTLTGNKGNDTLTGGAGRDVFVYKIGDGNDTITDYTAGQDTIQLTGSYTQSTVGNNVVLKVGSGSLTLRNAKGRKLNITTPVTSKSFIETTSLLTDENYNYNDLNTILKVNNQISTDYNSDDNFKFVKDIEILSISQNKSHKK